MTARGRELVDRVRRLGFTCDVVDQGGGRVWLKFSKLRTTAGNRLADGQLTRIEDDGTFVKIDSPKANVIIEGATFTFEVAAGIPSSPGAYTKNFDNADAVYEEILHYYFDPDSRMSLEDGFEPGPGRPAGA